MARDFTGPATRLSEGDVAAEAKRYSVEPAIVWAVWDVEAPGGGFLPDKRPKILYEAHVFGRQTKHRWDRSHPNISARKWDRSLYGRAGAHQYARLQQAIALSETAALQSASWGAFQVLGLNSELCGFKSVSAFVHAMCEGEPQHLDAFWKFCTRRNIVQHLRAKNWSAFVRVYNGPGQVPHYTSRLVAAYRKRSARR